ncbi:MAG: GAF domain-containing sensor histidine kinase [Thermoleophilia bacterium]|nr:GAF domain-containing sensor histidine kinase [Thermoleophilia bacterium]
MLGAVTDALLALCERTGRGDAGPEETTARVCALLDDGLGLEGTAVHPADAVDTRGARAAALLDADARCGLVDVDGVRVAVVDRSPAATVAGTVRPGTPGPDADSLSRVGRIARAALAVSRHAERSRRAEVTSERLVLAGIRLASHGTLAEVLDGLVSDARDLVDARYAALGVLSPGGDALERFITAGMPRDQREAIGPEPRGRGLLGVLLRDPRPMRIPDISADPRSCGFPDHHPPMCSFLGVPVTHRGEVFGNLYLTDKRGAPAFSDADERVILTLASLAAVVITNQRRHDAEARRRRELETVHEVAGAILTHRDLSTLLPLIVSRARDLCGADTVAMGQGDDDVRFAVTDGLHGTALERLLVPGTPGGCAARLRDDIPGTDVVAEPLELTSGGRGLLVAIASAPLDSGARRMLSLFARQASVALDNAHAFAAERRRLADQARTAAAETRAAMTAEAMQRAIDAQEAERARIARELHDETGQSLTALALALRMLEDHVDDEGRERLGALRQDVNGIAGNLRTLAIRLRPSGLREHGLASAIERMAARLGDASDIRIDAVVSGRVDDLPDALQVGLLRVVQEALTNVVRHSGAARASVLVTRNDAHVRAVVEDDGHGFDPSAHTNRLGLRGMGERVEILGGSLRIESAPGEGATVIVDVGLKP